MTARLLLALLAVLAYALLSHWLMTHAADRPWAILAIFGPLLLSFLGWAWRVRHVAAVLTTSSVIAGLVAVSVLGGLRDVHRLYLAQHAGVHLLLCATFAVSLRRGGEPLISRMAAFVHRTLSPDMAIYTRRLTQVWAGYFLSMALISFGLYGMGTWEQWSVMANLVTPVSAVSLFVGEHFVRYALHPEFERATLADAVRAYRHSAEEGQS